MILSETQVWLNNYYDEHRLYDVQGNALMFITLCFITHSRAIHYVLKASVRHLICQKIFSFFFLLLLLKWGNFYR